MEEEFKKLISELKFHSSQELIEPSETINVKIPNDYDHLLSLFFFYKIYENQISFLYDDFKENKDKNRISNISKKLNLEIPARVTIVGWQVNHFQDPRFLTLEENKKILFSALKNINLLKTGDGINKPKEGDILVGHIWDGSLTSYINHPINLRKRSMLNKRYGFGEVDQYNYQYSVYDKNLNLNPI